MEDVKKQINYRKEWIKKDLKNSMPLITDPSQRLLFLNQQLEKLFTLGLITGDTGILNTVIKYREEQNRQEDMLEAPQRSMLKNMDNILENLMTQL